MAGGRVGAALALGLCSWALVFDHSGVAQTRHNHHRPNKAVHHPVRHGTKTHRSTKASEAAALRPLIVIDPGHGGHDPGAIGVSGTLEKNITLATALELRRALLSTGHYRVALTRTGDRSVSLESRLAFAKQHDADLLIAIHADASPNHNRRGASVYVSSGHSAARLTANRGNAENIAAALGAPAPQPEPGSGWLQYSMIEQLADSVRMVVTPARAAHLYVLGSRTIPGVLLEMGFLSNRRDEALLNRPSHRRVLVGAIRDAIEDYFKGIRSVASRT